MKNLNIRKLLQVSMDGPNVNIKFLRLLKSYLQYDISRSVVLLDMGSCGLHNVHNSFELPFEKVKWPVKKFLTASHFLFHNNPARKGDYIKANPSSKTVEFPLSFCSTR